MPDAWRSPALEDVADALLALPDRAAVLAFLRDLCTVGELEAMAHRLAAARLVARGAPYQEVARSVGTSTTTVTRVAHWLRHGEGGYAAALAALDARDARA